MGSAPPELLPLAGHPLRWRLLVELSRSDRRVHELTVLLDEPQSLVSYHLGKLRAAGLVAARRSSADGRDTYYTLDVVRLGALLDDAGAALHPALRRAATTAPLELSEARVLYLCTGNSARSRMAAALTLAMSGGAVDARSAGSHPKALHPNAVRVMRERHGIELEGPPTHLDDLSTERFDRVVTLCDRVRELCPDWAGTPATHWSMADPAAAGGDDDATYPAFEQTAVELERRIELLLVELAGPAEKISA